jgi:hypothetical protein
LEDIQPPTNSRPSSIGKLILAALCVIIVLLLYDRFSASQSESCKSHIGETTLIGTQTAVDARWSMVGGCEIKVSDTSYRVFSHVSPTEAKPDEWQSESRWQGSMDIERAVKEQMNRSN